MENKYPWVNLCDHIKDCNCHDVKVIDICHGTYALELRDGRFQRGFSTEWFEEKLFFKHCYRIRLARSNPFLISKFQIVKSLGRAEE